MTLPAANFGKGTDMKKTIKKSGLVVKTSVKAGGLTLNHNVRRLGR